MKNNNEEHSRYMAIVLLCCTAMLPLIGNAYDSAEAMAAILLELNHFPTAAHKETLSSIEGSEASAAQKQLAQIISRIAHKPSDADKALLQALLDSDAGTAEKVIAKAVLNMNHKPQADDLQALRGLLPASD